MEAGRKEGYNGNEPDGEMSGFGGETDLKGETDMSEGTKNVVTTEEGALSVKKLTFWEAAMIIVGANIGAGILGWPIPRERPAGPFC